MCMGAAPRSTIAMPDTGAYDRMLDQQIALMNSSSQQQMLLQQERYSQALLSQQGALAQLNQAAQQRAADTTANAQRMAALIGTPQPEPTAQAPAVASNRDGRLKPQGKDRLRIDRAGAASAAGTGLNIGA